MANGLTDKVEEKINPFLQKLKAKGLLENFDVSDWLKKGADAHEFAEKNLTEEEKEKLEFMVYTSMLLES